MNGNNDLNNNGRFAGMALAPKTPMKTYSRLYNEIVSYENLILAWKNARKRKTKKSYVIEFEQEIFHQLMALHYELKYQTYKPRPLQSFVIRDPKTRKISKSHFRDRIVHHALCNIIEPLFDKAFIYDSCANRKGKGNLFAVQRFDFFKHRVSHNSMLLPNQWSDNNHVRGYCLKADIKHYFPEVDHDILFSILKKKIADTKVLWLIQKILNNNANPEMKRERESNIVAYATKRHASRQSHLAILRQCLSQ